MARSPHRVALALVVVFARAASADPGTARLVGPFAPEEYPQAVIDRPLTLPAGMVEVEVGGSFTSRRFETPVLGITGADDWNVDLDVRVGVTDRIQVEAGTVFSLGHVQHSDGGFQGGAGFDLRPSLTSWQRVVPFRLSVLALDTETLDTAVTLTLPFVARASRTILFFREGSMTFTNSGSVLPAVELAAPTRWRLTDWLWVRAGENLFRVTTGEGIARFAFDVGVGVQLHRLVAITLDSRIARIRFDGDGSEGSRTLADAGTIDLEGVFVPLPSFDVVGTLGLPNVGRGFDDYVIRMAVRVRF